MALSRITSLLFPNEIALPISPDNALYPTAYFIGGTGSLSGSHHANSSSDTDLTYTWTDGSWSITGEATTKKGFGYNWSDTASNGHDTGCTSGSDCGKHEEEATVKWDYNSGVWSISSVEGGGCGTYDYACDWDSCTTYERGFYESTISGTQCAYSNHYRNDSWDVSFKLINGQVVRETEGTSTETIDRGCSFCGNGSYQDSNDTTSTGTYCYYGTGTNTYHSEIEATHCESGSQSYLETITSQWSNKANEQGYLVQNNSADLHITAKADGFYCSYLYNYSCSHYDASYDYSCNYGCGCGCYSYGYYSCGCVHTDSVSEHTTDMSEHYTATLNEHWHSDGGAFNRVSFGGTASGGGSYDAPTSSSSHRDKYDKYGSTSSYGCGCSYSCSSSTDCSYDSCSESWTDVDYDFTASWGWNNDDEISASVSNHVTGDIGGTSSSSWHCEYGYSYGCGCGCTYNCGGCSHYDQPEGDYDETISHTGWKNGQYGPLFTTRWSPFSGSVSEYSYCCTYNYGCGCSYDYSYSCFYGYFSAPNFSSYVSDSTYSGCQYISGSTSHAGNYWWSDSHGSMPASQIPSEGGRYHSGSYDYYGYVYVGSNFNSPVGDSGTTMETPTPIEGGRIPDFANYTLVSVEAYLPPLPEVTATEPTISSSASGSWFSVDSFQLGLDAAGFVPGPAGMVADLTNAGIHIVRGNYAEAGWSVIGFVPIIGDSLKGAHTLKKTADITAGAVSQGAKHADDAAGLGKTTVKSEQKACIDGERKCKNGLEEQGQCFTEGTQIVVGAEYTEDNVFVEYVTVNIEDVEVGDLVYSYDTVTGEVSQQEVTATFALESDHLNYLTIVDDSGNEQVIETTDSHPFWVVTDEPDLEKAAREIVDENGVILYHENLDSNLNGFWVEAKDLCIGDVFLGANGELSALVETERVVFPDGIKVYNFTVAGNHDYYVIAETDEFGQTSILVHNSTCAPDKLVRHHTIPKVIQKRLPPNVANDPSIIGKKGLPNIKQIPYWLHKAIHRDYRGGAYVVRFWNEINSATKGRPDNVTVEQVLKIRDMLVKEFGL